MAEPAAVPGVDPSRVSTPGELAACLDGLRRRCGLSYEAIEKAAAKLPPRPGGSRLEPLPKSTVGEIVTGKRLPAKGKLLTFLTVCEVAPAGQAQWLAAWERVSTVDLARPVGGVRVRDARPRLLGVHAAISVPGVPDDVPPQYVPRDVDAAELGVRAQVEAAARTGGFVLLVGGSSVGKTRCAVEAVKALLPEWWLLHPAGPAEVSALAQAPSPRTVVWLDELQRYLDGEDGLTGGVVRALLNGPHPIVIVGTLWPDRYNAYTAVPAPGATDLHAREREMLDLAAVIRIAPKFSPAEQDRARAAAARDRRLAVALGAAGYGLTQTLAAAPQLVARWVDATTDDPYAWAVLTAALDVARLGARGSLSPDLLRAAAPGYCSGQQQAEAPDNWFEQALAYATHKLHGAAAVLASAAGAGMGQVAGYTVADYLVQHASRERRYERLPASTWDAVLSYIRDPADAARLADSAERRLLYCYAIPLYRHAADAGDQGAVSSLIRLLAGRGDVDELRARADARNRDAAGNRDTAMGLVQALAVRGDQDGVEQAMQAVQALVDAEGQARARLAERDLDGLPDLAAAGDQNAAAELVQLLTARRDLDGLRAWAAACDQSAAAELVLLLAERGDHWAAAHALRAWAEAGDRSAISRLAELLADREDRGGLRALADAGDRSATWRLALLLAQRDTPGGAVRLLRGWADPGNQDETTRLAELLADRGDLDGLHALADVGNQGAASWLAQLLADRGDLDGLRPIADAGNPLAALRLVDLLAERGDLDGLRALADAGNENAAMWRAQLLKDRGDLDGLRALADVGDEDADIELARLLVERGDVDGLRALAVTGNQGVAWWLRDLMTEQGHGEEAERLHRFGMNPDGSIAQA
jgi:hypothetical protein